MKALVLIALVCASTSACDSSKPGPPSASGPTTQRAELKTAPVPLKQLSAATGGAAISGYKHARAQSAFWLGGGAPSIIDDGQVRRYEGTDGVFIEWANGFTLGIPNARSAAKFVAPFATKGVDHDARVYAYFTGAGLPTDQIGSVQALASMHQGGRTADPTDRDPAVLDGYMSVLSRSIDGVSVVGSYAWAQFNANDDVVAEQVWWPALPNSLHADIANFRAQIGDSAKSAAFRSRLPSTVAGQSGDLRIHHAMPSGDTWFAAVTLDFYVAGPSGYSLSFDLSGTAVAVGPFKPGPGGAKP